MLAKKALSATAGAPKLYVEDVMSCFLYTGNGSTQTITNNIDLSGEGGLVWIKQRDGTANHTLTDTARGTDFQLASNSNVAQSNVTTRVTAFNTTGFNLGASSAVNGSPNTYASWTFRKAKKFFDVVTFTQSGTSGYQTINHNLGSVPGVIIIKGVGQADGWFVYHRSIPTQVTYLNQTNAAANFTLSNSVTSTTFNFNLTDFGFGNGATYVAYLFAHDAGGFGDAGSDNVISCGSYTGNGSSTGPTVTLGYEPQWLLIKRTDSAYGWFIQDNMREMSYSNHRYLIANTSGAEGASGAAVVKPLATGFQLGVTDAEFNASGGTYIYIAIRRGPMKTPTTGTSVFTPIARTGTGSATTISGVGFAADLLWDGVRNTAGYGNFLLDKLRGGSQRLGAYTTAAEVTESPAPVTQFENTSVNISGSGTVNDSGVTYVNWLFQRAPGFFDVVCYTGDGTNNRNINHNLGVAPELLIAKRRSATGNWFVLLPSGNVRVNLNNDLASPTYSGAWAGTTPTATTFSLGSDADINASASTYVTYLFASLSGVSKIGTYTGNGSSVTVTTNFQPRFILVKRTDSTGNWIVSDSARGLVAGNDPYLLLNSTAAEDTDEDWVDVSSTSFTVNQTTASNANVNTGTYIYLAIA